MGNKPEKQVAKAGKQVGKALAVFVDAADKLDAASAQHLSVADQLQEQASSLLVQADTDYMKMYADAEAAFDAAVEAAERHASQLEAQAEVLLSRKGEVEQAAFDAQVQADNVRSLLAVA